MKLMIRDKDSSKDFKNDDIRQNFKIIAKKSITWADDVSPPRQ